MFAGVSITPLKRIYHEKGDIYHAMKSSEESFSSFGEAYFSTINFSDVKGWKKHQEMTMNIVVPIGSIKFVLFDGRPNSTTQGRYFETVICESNYVRLTVPPGIWTAFQGIASDVNLLLNIASVEHDPNEAVSVPLDEIPYDWKS
ncbi:MULTISPECIES: dTDP-4-dehydrorhamnose 3,5-epimerase family protein [Vibrio]|uniref:dTDP-4-dehydrorhamnose 3,5-epimerase family protein n=1 Tax=Vibrio TaxID=662 RepID=UPI001EC3DEE6|nr:MULTISPECIES: dTDP-4-dehydrorhamnose 3,5-epimerase family protein [unclassified Vibrio]MDA0119790.1 dTDP-4-dehydrorhamnose 3,5-epimerase family protein [Vibrio sp. T11.5]NRB68598.1 dTDP-4-dehydrorhamnose 3,5-epimerase family protein [Vibrio sp.]